MSDHFKTVIDALKLFLNCDTSVGIPQHLTVENNIQKITDSNIRFVAKFERQQKHNFKIKNLAEIEKQRIDTVVLNDKKNILLCDDIATTGETMSIYEQFLIEKVKPDRIEKFAIAHKKTADTELKYMVAVQEEQVAEKPKPLYSPKIFNLPKLNILKKI